MALSIKEKTKQETLNLFKSKNDGYTPGYIRIFRCDIDYESKSFTATLKMYADKETRDDNPFTGKSTIIGGNIPQSAIDAMAKSDNRDILYKYIEASVFIEEIIKERDTAIQALSNEGKEVDKEAINAEYELKIEEVYNTFKIEKS